MSFTELPAATEWVSLSALSARLGVSDSTLAGWIKTGVRLPDGRRVKLRAVRVGVRWRTTEAWIGEFLGACNAVEATEPTQPEPAAA